MFLVWWFWYFCFVLPPLPLSLRCCFYYSCFVIWPYPPPFLPTHLVVFCLLGCFCNFSAPLPHVPVFFLVFVVVCFSGGGGCLGLVAAFPVLHVFFWDGGGIVVPDLPQPQADQEPPHPTLGCNVSLIHAYRRCNGFWSDCSDVVVLDLPCDGSWSTWRVFAGPQVDQKPPHGRSRATTSRSRSTTPSPKKSKPQNGAKRLIKNHDVEDQKPPRGRSNGRSRTT